MASVASESKFDIREDEEQYEKLEKCVDLLVAAGYFRARVKGTAAFDKIVGGMVWCVAICNYSVEVDILYEEHLSLGQKIAVTEKVVEVLPLVGCPHSIEPHQIQGLDFIHIFPVIQWLVKRVIEVREERGDDLAAFLAYSYRLRFPPTHESDNDLTRMRQLSCDSGNPKRLHKRKDGADLLTLHNDVLCTLAEYDNGRVLSQDLSLPGSQKEEFGLERGSQREKVAGRMLKELLNTDDMINISEAIINAQIDSAVTHDATDVLHMLREEERILDQQLAEEEEICRRTEEEANEVDNTISQYKQIMDGHPQEDIVEAHMLINEYNSLWSRETEFKKSWKEELRVLEDNIRQLEKGELEPDERVVELERELETLREEASTVSKNVAHLQKIVDSSPSHIELAQYHKRFLELGNEIIKNHIKTRKAFTDHNTTIDVLTYTKKELQLLNTIEEIIKARDDYRDGLLDKMQSVLKGVEKNLDRFVTKDKELEDERDSAQKQLGLLKEKERLYYQTSSRVQEGGERNASLRTRLATTSVAS